MLSIEKLKAYGADVESGLERCMNSEEFYFRMINTLVEEDHFSTLEKALNDNNLDLAFDAAHALKGVVGNLSLTPLYKELVEITELLRSRTVMDYSENLNKIEEKKNILRNLVSE